MIYAVANPNVQYYYDNFTGKKPVPMVQSAITAMVIRVAKETGFSAFLGHEARVFQFSEHIYQIRFSKMNSYVDFEVNLNTGNTKMLKWGN